VCAKKQRRSVNLNLAVDEAAQPISIKEMVEAGTAEGAANASPGALPGSFHAQGGENPTLLSQGAIG